VGTREARAGGASAAAAAGRRAGTLSRPLLSLPRETVRAVLSAVVGSVGDGNVGDGGVGDGNVTAPGTTTDVAQQVR
jgi:hypothetical protein